VNQPSSIDHQAWVLNSINVGSCLALVLFIQLYVMMVNLQILNMEDLSRLKNCNAYNSVSFWRHIVERSLGSRAKSTWIKF